MQEQYKKYESYRDSGIPWLEEIPAEWSLKKGKWIHTHKKRLNSKRECENVLSLTLRGVVNNDPDSPEGLVPQDYRTYQLFNKGDLVFKLIDLENFRTSRVGLVHEHGIMSSAYVRIVPDAESNPKYHYYFYYHLYLEGVYNKLGAGVRSTLNYTDLLNLPVPAIERKTQDRIVSFLDHKIIEIDAAIGKKQRLIELLKEQKSIIINQAVTKGLNPNAPMKDSGVTWIGKIPDHWEIVANRYLFREANDRSKGGLETHLSMSQKLGLVPANQVEKSLTSESYDGAKLVQVNDLVLNRLKAHLSVFSSAYCSGLVSPDYSVFRLISPKNTVFYFENLFRTSGYLGEFNRRVKGIVVGFLRLYSDDFMSIPTIVPPANEQLEICARLKKINEEFAVVFNTTEKEIAKLNEFKQTLIAHAVTGKIKV
jgi:type I restriction enzyme, S subunit